MEQIITFLQEFWIETLVVVSAGLITALHKKLIKWIGWIIQRTIIKAKKFFGIRTSCPVPGIREALERIQEELKPNHGSSIKDVVNRIEYKISAVATKLNVVVTGLDIVSDTLNICRFAADHKGKINFVNKSMRELIGSTDDFAWAFGDAWTNAVYKDDREAAIEEWQRCVNSKIEYHDTFRVVHIKTGEVIEVTSHAKVIRNGAGEIEGWVGVVIPHESNR